MNFTQGGFLLNKMLSFLIALFKFVSVPLLVAGLQRLFNPLTLENLIFSTLIVLIYILLLRRF